MAIKTFKSSAIFRECVETINSDLTTVKQQQIIQAGEKALLTIYHGNQHESINSLRASLFIQKVACSKSAVEPCSLPPTTSATTYHTLRVYHKVQTWKGEDLPPEEWGWKRNGNGQLQPISTDRSPAPQKLLNLIRCSCKSHCRTLRCTCKKHGLSCTAVCRECRGVSCTNSMQVDTES